MSTTTANPAPKNDFATLFRSDRPSKPLYHYTNQTGLLGIVKEKKIWATHYQYLNDTQEFLHAKGLIRAEIEKRYKSANSENRSVLEALRSAIDGWGKDNENWRVENRNGYVASFSEDPDSLSQWRAYGGPTSGFALGFRCDQLVFPINFTMKKCIYAPNEQREFAEEIVRSQLESALSEKVELGSDGLGNVAAGMELCMKLDLLALIFKHEKFKCEEEWRIFSPSIDNKSFSQMSEKAELAFREGKSMLTPLLKVPLKDDKGRFPLDSVVVGPGPNNEQSLQSVRSLLLNDEEDLSFAAMKSISSDIPYRNW
jgi:hypothetical protein